MKIAVIGLGYVGAVTSACLANEGHRVIGVDRDPTKLDLIRRGQAPVIEDEIDDRIAAAVRDRLLDVRSVVDHEVVSSDIVFVCVGTPSAPNGSQDLTAVERVCEQLGRVLSSHEASPAIVIRSTVPPGTTDGLVRRTLESSSGKQPGVDFGLGFQPEFLREGSSVKDFHRPPLTVVGGDERAIAAVRTLFGSFPGEFVATDTRTAELLKVACNTFHAVKVSFANEIGRLGQTLGMDPRTVMELLCADTQLNISPAYLRPGFAFGGSCLPKDLRALLYLAKSHDVDLPMLQGVLPSNVRHIDNAADMVMGAGHRNVGFIGLSFKQGTDDLRESPLVALAERLIGKGYVLKVYDPAVSLAMLVGSNKSFIEETIPHIGTMMCNSLQEVLEHADTVVLGHKSPEIEDTLRCRQDSLACLVDLAGISAEGWQQYRGACW